MVTIEVSIVAIKADMGAIRAGIDAIKASANAIRKNTFVIRKAQLYNIFTSKIRDGNGRSLPFKPKARWFKTKEALILKVKGSWF